MPLPTGTILGILSDNLRKRGSVLPLSKAASTRWAKGLDLPRGGETVIYTGHMYQLIPAIEAMSKQMAYFENSPITRFFGLGRFMNRFVNLSFFMSLLASGKQRRDYDQMLVSIVRLLHKAGITFGYLYGDEMYSGTLIYDEGLDEIFAPHAKRVYEAFQRNGVKRIITVDPHTTHMMRHVYPKFIENYDIEVVNYMELLAEKDLPQIKADGEERVIHDSCVYARYEEMIDPPRQLLSRAGLTIREPELCGKATHCCGGPIEALFPSEAHRIAGNRVEQLREAGDRIVTMCPICLVNLRKAAGDTADIDDIASVLAKRMNPS